MLSFFKNKKISLGKLLIFGVIAVAIISVSMSGILHATPHAFAQPANGQLPAIPTQAGPEEGFDIFDPMIWINWAIAALGLFFLQWSSWVLTASGFILEAVIKMSVLNVQSFLSNDAVVNTWITFRDIANMVFIFIILYIAIGTILGLGGIDIKRMLARVVIIALLLNFSMFFTKIAIDASNIVTIGFYNQIVSSPSCQNTTVGAMGGIGGAFVCKLGITNIFDPAVHQNIMQSTGGDTGAAFKQLLLGIIGSIFISITAFVLLAIALMFIVRLVTFVFLLFLSPLAFVAMALPSDNYSSKWKEPLISNCLFAPAIMAMLWAVLQISTALPQAPGIGAAIIGTSAGRPVPGMGESLLNYVILIALIIASLMIAKEFGAYGAGGALGSLKSAQKWTQGKINGARTWTQAKVGRGIVRGTGIAALDRKFSDTEFAKSYAGKYIRGATTGAITSAEFGQKGGSVQKIDKERKKIQEEMAKDINKGLEKKLDKKLPELRDQRIKDSEAEVAKLDKQIQDQELSVARAQEEVDKKEAEFKKLRDAGGAPSDADIVAQNANRQKLTDLKEKAQDLRSERGRTLSLIKNTKESKEKNTVASKDEKNLWLTKMQQEKEKELKLTRDERVQKQQEKLDGVNKEAQQVRKNVSTLEAEISKKEAALAKQRSAGITGPRMIAEAAAINADKAKLKELQDKIASLKKDAKAINDAMYYTTGDMLNALPLINPYAVDRKKVADELKKLYRSGGSKDINSALKDIVDETGGGGDKGGGDKGGGDKK